MITAQSGNPNPAMPRCKGMFVAPCTSPATVRACVRVLTHAAQGVAIVAGCSDMHACGRLPAADQGGGGFGCRSLRGRLACGAALPSG